MFNLFGSKKHAEKSGKGKKSAQNTPEVPPNPSQTIESLDDIDKKVIMYEKRAALLAARVQQIETKAKEALAAGNKTSAKTFVKQKLQLSQQLTQVEAFIMRLTHVRGALESAAATAEMTSALSGATGALKDVNASVNPDAIGDVMDDLNEAIEDSTAVSDMLNTGLPGMDTLDMDLDDEMAALDAEIEADRWTQSAADATKQAQVGASTGAAAAAAAAAPAPAPAAAGTHAATVAAAATHSSHVAAAEALPTAPAAPAPTASSADADIDAELAALDAELG